MIKKPSSQHFAALKGDKDLAGRCGDTFTINGNHTIQIIGYTDSGASYLVRSLTTGGIYRYFFKSQEGM